jgi:hypothetical protein
MAHYAFLDENNTVTEVIAGVDETELIEGLTPEIWYGNFRNQKCIRTSYNANIRKNYASVGGRYDEDFDAFIAPQLYPSWKLNHTTYQWEAPVVKPEDTQEYYWKWSEINKEWIKITIPTE